MEEPIGNLYDCELEAMLRCRPCPRTSCGCYIGYIHLDHLELGRVYGDGVLERIPIGMPIADDQARTNSRPPGPGAAATGVGSCVALARSLDG